MFSYNVKKKIGANNKKSCFLYNMGGWHNEFVKSTS